MKNILLLFVLISVAIPVKLTAQWTKTNEIYGGYIRSLITFPNSTGGINILAGTWGGLFLSTNNGTSWAKNNNGITNQPIL
ncbi:MAG: hypothetical protein P4L45_12955, partial [Ignavibacteriaceae bacterium]|nr:hypothetical protein [Ignavibacteriaceae bacterium]